MATAPREIASQLRFDIGDAVDFSADLLEEVNAHYIAAALRAFNLDEIDIAQKFLMLERDLFRAGQMTPGIQKRADALMRRLSEARGE